MLCISGPERGPVLAFIAKNGGICHTNIMTEVARTFVKVKNKEVVKKPTVHSHLDEVVLTPVKIGVT